MIIWLFLSFLIAMAIAIVVLLHKLNRSEDEAFRLRDDLQNKEDLLIKLFKEKDMM